MKFSIIKLSFLALIIILTTFACKPEEVQDIALGTLKAKIGTESFESTGAAASIYSDQLGISETLTLIGSNLQFNSMGIVFSSSTLDITNKTYTETGDGSDCVPSDGSLCVGLTYTKLTGGEEWGNFDAESEVKVVVSSVDYRKGGSIKGTFEGKLYNVNTQESIDVTEGVFNLKIAE